MPMPKNLVKPKIERTNDGETFICGRRHKFEIDLVGFLKNSKRIATTVTQISCIAACSKSQQRKESLHLPQTRIDN